MTRTTLGKYEIRGHLGKGASAEVLLAWHPVLRAPRALKVPFDQSPETTDKLTLEARTQAQLLHPNICQVYDTDEADGTFFLVMEYAAGGSLRRLLKDGPLEASRAVGWMVQVVEALRYAHSRDVVHRDLKPDNLLLSAEDAVKVADFGLARILRPTEEARTRAGTVPYMAPEHLKGQATFLSDLWSLGVVFYELLTGAPPFRAESQWELASRIMSSDPEPFGEGVLDHPPELWSCIRRLLERDPARRTPSAEALAEELRGLQPLLGPGPLPRAVRRPEAEDLADVLPSQEPTVVAHDWPQGRGGPRRAGSVAPALVLPLQMAWRAEVGSSIVAPPVVGHGLVVVGTTGGELVLVEEARGRIIERLAVGGSLPAAPAVLDGKAYVGGYGGRLAAVDLVERSVEWEAELGAPVGATPATSKDTLFVPLLDGRLVRLQRAGGAVSATWTAHGALASAPLVIDGLVVVGSRDHRLYALEQEGLSERWRWEAGGWIDGGPAASGGLVVVGSYDGTVTALELATGRVRWQVRLPAWVAAGAVLDDECAYVLAFDGTLAALELRDGTQRWRVRTKGRHLGGPALSGELLVIAGAEGLITARLAADGAERWSAPLEGECLGGPTVAGSTCYVAGRDGSLMAFR
ncbi:MAG: serine/threonine-protein kinase [bacterium]|nr:serine/threonine-protein kinase [bacterium]